MWYFKLKTMSFRALALLALFLLFQAGRASVGVGCVQETATTCSEGCCEAVLPGEAGQCCQMEEAPPGDPVAPASPIPAGSQRAPLTTVWSLQEAWLAIAPTQGTAEVQVLRIRLGESPARGLPMAPLTVLHCSFLT